MAAADYNRLGTVAPLPVGGFSQAEIAGHSGDWAAYAAAKYGSLPAGSRVYLDLETMVTTEASSAAVASLITDTKAALPDCLVGTYFLPITDYGAVGGGRQAAIEAANDSYASAIAAADWLGFDAYQVAWTPPPGNEEWDWNVNECIRVRAGKPLAPFLTTSHATGGGLVTPAEFLSITRALHARDIRELTLWKSVTTAEEGADFVSQVLAMGTAILLTWGERRVFGLGASGGFLNVGVVVGP